MTYQEFSETCWDNDLRDKLLELEPLRKTEKRAVEMALDSQAGIFIKMGFPLVESMADITGTWKQAMKPD